MTDVVAPIAELVRLRLASGLSQAAVATAMGTTQSAISELEAGQTDPRMSTLLRYARAVGAGIQIRGVHAPHVPAAAPESAPESRREESVGSLPFYDYVVTLWAKERRHGVVRVTAIEPYLLTDAFDEATNVSITCDMATGAQMTLTVDGADLDDLRQLLEDADIPAGY